MASDQFVLDTAQSLERIQAFDVTSLARKEDLGRLSFEEVVPSAANVVDMFRRIGVSSLQSFSEEQLSQIKQMSDSTYNLFVSVDKFDPEKLSNDERRNLISQVIAQPRNVKNALWNHIAYSIATSLDPIATQQQMRGIVQSFDDERNKALAGVETVKAEAEEILNRVRNAAAEQGVSQQASHFRAIAEEHSEESKKWLKYSIITAAVMLFVAILSAFSYRMSWIAPKNTVEAVQLITGKLVILGIFGYGLVVSVRNFLSHKHNSVVNKHRQNALLTYTAFVDAAPSNASREIVLTHAAASVFSPQDTGYIRHEDVAGGKSIMEIMTKASLGEVK